MIELIQAIAMLCMVPNGFDGLEGYGWARNEQLKCQQYYLRCVIERKEPMYIGDRLEECVRNTRIN